MTNTQTLQPTTRPKEISPTSRYIETGEGPIKTTAEPGSGPGAITNFQTPRPFKPSIIVLNRIGMPPSQLAESFAEIGAPKSRAADVNSQLEPGMLKDLRDHQLAMALKNR